LEVLKYSDESAIENGFIDILVCAVFNVLLPPIEDGLNGLGASSEVR
jgi:hypothetical protein